MDELFHDFENDGKTPVSLIREPVAARGPTLSLLVRALLVLSIGRVLLAIVMLMVDGGSLTPTAPWIPHQLVIVQLLSYGGTGAFLLLAHAHDRRTVNLGIVLTLIASTFAAGPIAALGTRVGLVALLVPLHPDAFFPFFVGRFVQAFPSGRLRPAIEGAFRHVLQIAAGAGVLLFVANAFQGWGLSKSLPWLASLQRRSTVDTVYWPVIFGLLVSLVPVAFSGLSGATADDRRRTQFFWAAFFGAFAPITATILLGTLPMLRVPVSRWAVSLPGQLLLQLPLATLPIVIAYTVLVRRLLPWRVVVRQAVQHLLARWAITAGCVIPVASIVLEAYWHRHETIEDAFAGHLIWPLVAAGLAGFALFARQDLLSAVDRLFFREAYDARRVLVDLGEHIREAQRIDELVARLTAGIDRALQPEAIAVLVRDPGGQAFVSLFGSAEPLLATSVLAEVLGAASQPLDVRVAESNSPLRWLPRNERQWLVDTRSSVLVPLRTSDAKLVGFITLADRKSELPYSSEDRWLLMAIADAGALTIESRAIRQHPAEASEWWRVGLTAAHARAAECSSCGQVFSPDREVCGACAVTLEPVDIPHVLFGKFRFEARVGRGAMGIVYRARDLTLERLVAIKTLPGTSPELAHRLRAEAKNMAAVTHRNLALIYGAESWRGRPMLICEFMTDGTLAEKIARRALAWTDALHLGVSLADALHAIHQAGLLHRDVKPSNIGYAQDGLPKLLDFGLVYFLSQSQAGEKCHPPRSAGDVSGPSMLSDLSVSQHLVGTPLYLSPEACRGRLPTVAFDLWSLNVLLLEAITGRHPFRGRTLEETLKRIQAGPVPETLSGLGRCPQSLTKYFERALSVDAGRRPSSALEVADALRLIARAS